MDPNSRLTPAAKALFEDKIVAADGICNTIASFLPPGNLKCLFLYFGDDFKAKVLSDEQLKCGHCGVGAIVNNTDHRFHLKFCKSRLCAKYGKWLCGSCATICPSCGEAACSDKGFAKCTKLQAIGQDRCGAMLCAHKCAGFCEAAHCNEVFCQAHAQAPCSWCRGENGRHTCSVNKFFCQYCAVSVCDVHSEYCRDASNGDCPKRGNTCRDCFPATSWYCIHCGDSFCKTHSPLVCVRCEKTHCPQCIDTEPPYVGVCFYCESTDPNFEYMEFVREQWRKERSKMAKLS